MRLKLTLKTPEQLCREVSIRHEANVTRFSQPAKVLQQMIKNRQR